MAASPCAKLFALVESDFTPLSLCQDAKPFLDQIASDDVCEGKLKDYARLLGAKTVRIEGPKGSTEVMPLKQIIFFRLIKQLSEAGLLFACVASLKEVYVSMTIEDFEHAASIVCGHTSSSCPISVVLDMHQAPTGAPTPSYGVFSGP